MNSNNLEKKETFINYININFKKIVLVSILFILILILIFILIKWYKSNKTEYIGYSYYSKDLSKVQNHIFSLNTISFDECKEKCIRTPKCYGITLNPIEEKCYGSGEGAILRKEPENKDIKSWIKPKDSIFNAKSELILSMTDKKYIIHKEMLIQPYTLGRYNYNFYIYINNYNSNNWKHVFHKGTEVLDNLNNNDWDNIIQQVPEQFIGVWIAPYNTYMRIAITTKNGIIEYVDIPNIPVKKLNFISVSLLDNIVEIYLDAKLIKTYVLKNIGLFNNGNIYVKNNNTFDGSIYYLTYTPEYINYNNILKIYNNSLSEIKKIVIDQYNL
jgi:hypothetical protein